MPSLEAGQLYERARVQRVPRRSRQRIAQPQPVDESGDSFGHVFGSFDIHELAEIVHQVGMQPPVIHIQNLAE